MLSHRGVQDGYARHLIRNTSLWHPLHKDEIRVDKILLRAYTYAVVGCSTRDGSMCALKVSNTVLKHLSSSDYRSLYTWKICGRIQLGIVLPTEGHDTLDPFLLDDKPQLPSGYSDPSYCPIPEFFDPWAQDFARYEMNAGYGQCLEDTTLWEPCWCWRFANHTDQSVSQGQDDVTVGSPPQAASSSGVTAPTEGYSVPTDTMQSIPGKSDNKSLLPDTQTSGATAPTEEGDHSLSEPWALVYTNVVPGRNSSMSTAADWDFEPWR